MPTPHRLSRKLNEILGPEAADAMVDWMNQADGNIADLRRDMAEFRQEVRADFAELRQEVHAEFARVREEMRVGFAQIDSKFSAMDAAAAQRHADFMKWTVGFWLVSLATLIGSIAAFARILA